MQLDDTSLARLAELHQKWKQFPGRAPNGTGLTGLTSSDSKGYSDLLNEQTEGMNLENALNGEAPMRVRVGGEIPSQMHGIAADPANTTATGPSPALLGLQKAAPEGYDEFAARLFQGSDRTRHKKYQV